jgi:hypothetical protein
MNVLKYLSLIGLSLFLVATAHAGQDCGRLGAFCLGAGNSNYECTFDFLEVTDADFNPTNISVAPADKNVGKQMQSYFKAGTRICVTGEKRSSDHRLVVASIILEADKQPMTSWAWHSITPGAPMKLVVNSNGSAEISYIGAGCGVVDIYAGWNTDEKPMYAYETPTLVPASSQIAIQATAIELAPGPQLWMKFGDHPPVTFVHGAGGPFKPCGGR